MNGKNNPLDGRYELGQLLGEGAMGRVFKAFDKELERCVALKMVQTGEGDISLLTDRLTKEALTCANLDHPNIVKVFDTFSHEGKFCIVMELIEGKSFARHLAERTPLETLLDYVLQVTKALEFAHNHGVVHRDLKPENILITMGGVAKVTDWGLARSIEEEKGLTKTGVIVGTPEYMAPERIMTTKISSASDIYALGCILYETIEGHPPFVGAKLSSVVQSHLYKSPSKIMAGPIGFSMLISRLLRKEPHQRLTASQVIDFLQGDKAPERLLADTTVKPIKKHSYKTEVLVTITIILLIALGYAAKPLVMPRRATKAIPSRLERLASGEEKVLKTIGHKLLRRKTKGLNSEAIFSALTKAAQKSGEANFYLGICYRNGLFTKPDYEKARLSFLRAGELGCPMAYCHLGTMYEGTGCFPQDYAKAVKYFEKAMKEGNTYGLVKLGNRYFWGGGVKQNGKRAFELFQEAYDKGNPYAAYYLGRCYEEGVATKLNWEKARKLYEIAAKAGYGAAANRLGLLYERGLSGTSKNEELAFFWYEKAYELGDLGGWLSLAKCYEGGVGVGKDVKKAVEWYKELMECNYPTAFYKVGQCYEKGLCFEKNTVKAFKTYQEGADLGSMACIECLSICYSKGIGCKRDPAKAEACRKQLGQSLLEEMLGRMETKLDK